MLAIRREMCIIDEQGVLPCSYGLVAQLGERSVRIREVEGSNPFRSTKMKTVRKGGFHFAVGLRESKFIPPCGGNPFRSTKQVLDEHLFLQRRLRREVFALIQNRKAPSWEKSQGGAFSIFLGLVYFLSYAIY